MRTEPIAVAIRSEAPITPKAHSPASALKPHEASRKARMAAALKITKFRKVCRLRGRFRLLKPPHAVDVIRHRPTTAATSFDRSIAPMPSPPCRSEEMPDATRL